MARQVLLYVYTRERVCILSIAPFRIVSHRNPFLIGSLLIGVGVGGGLTLTSLRSPNLFPVTAAVAAARERERQSLEEEAKGEIG